MTVTRKPREFWIEKSSFGIYQAVTDKSKLNGWIDPIHVREVLPDDPRDQALAIAIEGLKFLKDRVGTSACTWRCDISAAKTLAALDAILKEEK